MSSLNDEDSIKHKQLEVVEHLQNLHASLCASAKTLMLRVEELERREEAVTKRETHIKKQEDKLKTVIEEIHSVLKETIPESKKQLKLFREKLTDISGIKVSSNQETEPHVTKSDVGTDTSELYDCTDKYYEGIIPLSLPDSFIPQKVMDIESDEDSVEITVPKGLRPEYPNLLFYIKGPSADFERELMEKMRKDFSEGIDVFRNDECLDEMEDAWADQKLLLCIDEELLQNINRNDSIKTLVHLENENDKKLAKLIAIFNEAVHFMLSDEVMTPKELIEAFSVNGLHMSAKQFISRFDQWKDLNKEEWVQRGKWGAHQCSVREFFDEIQGSNSSVEDNDESVFSAEEVASSVIQDTES